MICPICGMDVDNDSTICPICGCQIDSNPEEKTSLLSDNICPVCGFVLENDDTVCPVCNTSIDDVKSEEPISYHSQDSIESNNIETTLPKNKSNKKRYFSVIFLFCLLIGAGAAGYFIIYPQITANIKEAENKKEAEKVINLIDSLSDKEITEDMTDELNLIQMSYHSLTKEQKKLVTNYDELKKALEFLKKIKDESQAKNIQEEIDLINTDNLTAEDTSVGELRRKYNALSKEQQKLVENAHKLDEYEKVIQTRIREKEQKEKLENQKAEQEQLLDEQKNEIKGLIYNFHEFAGKWGDFGIHINKYQGLIESAIKSKISLADYFSGAPNNLDMYASSFQWDGENINTAGCSVSFDGILLETDEYGTLAGSIIVNNDGTLEFYIDYIY